MIIPKGQFVSLGIIFFLAVVTFANGYENQTVQQLANNGTALDSLYKYSSNMSNTTSVTLLDDTINVVKWINDIEDPVLRKWVIGGAVTLVLCVLVIVAVSVIRGRQIRKRKDELRKALLRESFSSEVFYVDDVLDNTTEDKFKF